MIVSAGIATTAFARALTDDKVQRLHTAWDQRPETDPMRRVEDLIYEISEGRFFAGLLIDIEYEIWRLLHTADPGDLEGGPLGGKQVQALLDEIKALTIDADEPWWFAFDLDHTRLGGDVARRMPLVEWETALPERWTRRPARIIKFGSRP